MPLGVFAKQEVLQGAISHFNFYGPVDDGNGAAEVISVDQCDDVLHVLQSEGPPGSRRRRRFGPVCSGHLGLGPIIGLSSGRFSPIDRPLITIE